MLQYKTKGNVSPQGKRRVYFTCHPDDYDLFFDRISTDILKFSDCAIWFNPDDNYEDIDTDLGQMNLFVIPITTKLLTKPCRTMQLDVPFAIEKHIPILPLMQEGGLDELFTRYFGDLQYLDPNTHDITAISYEEKLKKYLNSVLVSDEMAEKVRAAFDAYIFLSYRKKDRKYANELMRLIHKNDFCRDIAIWYDEFLVPGEDFNDAISHALKKSDLFTMVVTPNLINEKNYVQTVEYPEAVKQNKIIIPTELEKTDYKSLSEKYPNIPNSINAYDKNALSDALQTALINIARRENDNDPQHNFFIGLAYLEGIDVEVDHDRALQLITSAAETNDVPEAIEKLVAMYNEGYGVKRDYREAVQWQQKLVEYWEREYEKSHNKEDCKKMIDSLYYLAYLFFNLKEMAKSKVSYKKLIELFEDNYDIEHNLMLNVYKDYGICCLFDNHLEEIEVCFKRVLPIIEQLKDRKLEKDYIYWQYEFYELLGKFYNAQEDLSKAEFCLLTACKLIAQLEIDEYSDRQLNLYNMLGMLYDKKNILYEDKSALTNADYFYQLALTLITRQGEYINKKFQEVMKNTYNSLGTHLLFSKKETDAEYFFQKGLDISKTLNCENESLNSLQALANSYFFIGTLYIKVGNSKKAESFYHKALYNFNILMDHAWSKDVQESMSMCYSSLGECYLKNNDLNMADEFYRKSTVLYEQLLERTDDINYLFTLASNYLQLGKIKDFNGDKKRTEFYYRKAIVLYEQLVRESKIEVRNELSIVYLKIAVILYGVENLDESEIFYQKSISLNKQLANESENVDALFRLALSYYGLGTLRIPYKQDFLKKAFEIVSLITIKNPQFFQTEENSKFMESLESMLTN